MMWKMQDTLTGEPVSKGLTRAAHDGTTGRIVSFKPPEKAKGDGTVYLEVEGRDWPVAYPAVSLRIKVVRAF